MQQLQKVLGTIFLVAVAGFMTACGGGGGSTGGGTPTPTGAAYILPDLYAKPAGTTVTFNMRGKDSLGNVLTGTIGIVSIGPVTVSGINYWQADSVTSLNVGNGGTVSNYLDPTTRELVYLYDSPAGITGNVTLTAKLPKTASIGDSGVLPTISWNNNNTETSSWELQAATGSEANLVITYVTKDIMGTQSTTQTDTYTIDASGAIKLYSIHVDSKILGFVYTLDLSGTQV